MNEHSLVAASHYLDKWLGYHANQNDWPGFVVAIYSKDKIVFSKAFGADELEAKKTLTTEHLFSLGSQAKMFTATAVMQLVECRRLSLDEPIATHLPWIKDHKDPGFHHITARQLLWHGAGIVRDGADGDYWLLERPFPDKREFRKEILNARHVLPRADRFKYSNFGFALLGQVVESVSGLSYQAYIEQSILRYLPDVGIGVQGVKNSELMARGYNRNIAGKRMILSQNIPTGALTPSAGLYGKAEAMCHFMALHFNGNTTLLNERSKYLLHHGEDHQWKPIGKRGTAYGMGFAQFEFGDNVFGHTGTFLGHTSCSLFDPLEKIAVAVTANAHDAPVETMTEGIYGVLQFFAENAKTPVDSERDNLNCRLMNLFTALDIIATPERIVAVLPDDWTPFDRVYEELKLLDKHTLLIESTSDMAAPNEEIEIIYDSSDKIIHARHSGFSMWPEDIYQKEHPSSS